MTDAAEWRKDLLRFWFGLDPAQWFKKDPVLDERVRDTFAAIWREKRALPPEHFVADPLTALAAVILFDQVPRNMFRGHADQFSTDTLALAIAKRSVELGFDHELEANERLFLYLPFEHSEALDDQRQSLILFTALGNPNYLEFAKQHHDIIERFGRFPHRNAMLGRASRADETASEDADPFG